MSDNPDSQAGATVTPEKVVWADDEGITWDNASLEIREQFALTRLYWFYRMVACGGPDGSELDDLVADEAREAADWLGPILDERAGMASGDGF
jgi:hypothetical protein